MSGFINDRFEKIVKKRAEYSEHVTLSHRKIYIVPSKLSLMLLIVISLIVLAGINYQNNVFYILAFWLLSLFIWNFILTFFNLSKLEVKAKKTLNVFAGDTAEFEFELSRVNKSVHGLNIKTDEQVLDSIFVDKKSSKSVFIKQKSVVRGKMEMHKMTFSTVFPFGFCYGFSYVYLNLPAWIYPKPVDANVLSVNTAPGDQQILEDTQIIGSEDFNQLKQYEPGERLGHIHWANYAKTGELKVKEFVDVNSSSMWIDWADFPMLEREARLSHLCFLILEAHKKNINFGLRLNNLEIEPVFQVEQKQSHLDHCLIQLAKF
ncbi:MAG: DUF58 domain-containing protein [Saccharospirillaceae bacterium]|nr:DUF58 domain-containing protein [Pseudomonadales bacterium]NRB81625.1 DUF58 domain-containing protein [Saccharospirillaceae bacterium]